MSYSGQEIVHAGGFGEGGFCVQGWELINMPLDFATIQFLLNKPFAKRTPRRWTIQFSLFEPTPRRVCPQRQETGDVQL